MATRKPRIESAKSPERTRELLAWLIRRIAERRKESKAA